MYEPSPAAVQSRTPPGSPLKLVETETDRARPPLDPEKAARRLLRSRLLSHPATEFGLLYMVLELYGDRLRYLRDEKVFLVWNGRVWARDDGAAANLVRKAIERCVAAAKGRPIREWLVKQQQAKKVGSVLTLLRSFDDPDRGFSTVPINITALDGWPRLLNVENGIVDLETGELLRHDPARLMTRIAGAKYLGPDADLTKACPTWLDFIGFGCDGCVEDMEFLQRCLGYTATGDGREKCFFILLGKPDTGKTTLLETTRAVLGDYAAATSMDSFIEKRTGSQTRSDLVRLGGRRFVTASEVPENAVLDHALIKALTGGDGTALRDVYEKALESTAGFKIWLGTNFPPRFRNSDSGLANRVRLIKWERLAETLDRGLRQTLIEERDGILTWIIRGAIDYHARGGLDVTTAAERAAAEYVESQSPILAFADQCLETDPKAPPIRVSRLYQAYVRWCDEQRTSPMTLNSFSRRLTDELRLEEGSRRQGKTRVGVRLREQMELKLGPESTGEEQAQA